MRKIVSLFLFFILFGGIAQNTYANYKAQVLGIATESSKASLPATAEGPGLILPDSPFFFMDELKQKIRVVLALTPEAKLKVHTQIAGERLAELRIMASRNNQKAVETDLRGIEDNLIEAATDIRNVELAGRNTTQYARDTNAMLKRIQLALDILDTQVSGNTKARVAVSQEALLGAKVSIEDQLPKDEMDNEFRDDLKWVIKRRINQTVVSATQLKEILGHSESKSVNKVDEKSLDLVLKAIEDMQKPTPSITPVTAAPTPTSSAK